MSRPGVRSPTAPKFTLQTFKRRLKLDFAKKIPLIVLVCAAASFSAENIVSFSSVVTVSDFLAVGDTLWAASSGGLAAHDLRNGGKAFVSNAKIFPDPYLTALCRDSRGNLWIGSRRGYLYKRTPRGQFAVFPSYKHSGWGVTCMLAYGDMIVVGSDRGVSLFDPEKGVAVRNATGISTFSNPRVNAIAVSALRDTLFLGCDEGVAYLDSLDVAPLAQRNFYYPGIWKKRAGPSFPASSLVNTGSSVEADSVPSAMFRGYLFKAVEWVAGEPPDTVRRRGLEWRHGDSGLWKRTVIPADKILKLYNEGDNRLWIGTKESFYYSYNGESEAEQHWIDGFALRRGSRVMAAPGGEAWVLPEASTPNLWYQGIYMYDGKNWRSYSYSTYGEKFGYIGEGGALGGAFGRDGTLWAGTYGGNIKHIDPVKNTVGQLMVGNKDFKNVAYHDDVPPAWNVWGKVDALAVDSSGYLWASVYDHYLGSLICYDPRYEPASWEPDPVKARYRWFFSEPSLKTLNITELAVDAGGRIYAYDAPQNRLTVFRHRGNPLAGGIEVDTTYPSFGVVAAVRASPDGGAYIAGAGGLMKIPAGSLKVEVIDNTLNNASDLAVQGNILWVGTRTSGVLRYDLDRNEKKWTGEADGLPSDNVLSAAIDGKKGYLWILTESAVSRLDVGRAAKPERSEAAQVFPNVFSIGARVRGADQITFARLAPRSTVSVYAVNGALVAKVGSEYFTENEWRAAWTPKRTLTPGTYIAVIKPSGKKVKILLKP